MPSALVWNALVQIYSQTCAEYTLMECAHVECTHTCIEYTRITTRIVNLPFCLLSSWLNYYVFNLRSYTILVLTAY